MACSRRSSFTRVRTHRHTSRSKGRGPSKSPLPLGNPRTIPSTAMPDGKPPPQTLAEESANFSERVSDLTLLFALEVAGVQLFVAIHHQICRAHFLVLPQGRGRVLSRISRGGGGGGGGGGAGSRHSRSADLQAMLAFCSTNKWSRPSCLFDLDELSKMRFDQQRRDADDGRRS